LCSKAICYHNLALVEALRVIAEAKGVTVAQIERAVPAGAAAGDRYPAVSMARLDSERSQAGNI